MKNVRVQNREPGNKRFAFNNDFSRICICGHTLGVHGPGGIECLVGTNVPDDPNPPGVECECVRFKQSRRKSSPLSRPHRESSASSPAGSAPAQRLHE